MNYEHLVCIKVVLNALYIHAWRLPVLLQARTSPFSPVSDEFKKCKRRVDVITPSTDLHVERPETDEHRSSVI